MHSFKVATRLSSHEIAIADFSYPIVDTVKALAKAVLAQTPASSKLMFVVKELWGAGDRFEAELSHKVAALPFDLGESVLSNRYSKGKSLTKMAPQESFSLLGHLLAFRPTVLSCALTAHRYFEKYGIHVLVLGTSHENDQFDLFDHAEFDKAKHDSLEQQFSECSEPNEKFNLAISFFGERSKAGMLDIHETRFLQILIALKKSHTGYVGALIADINYFRGPNAVTQHVSPYVIAKEMIDGQLYFTLSSLDSAGGECSSIATLLDLFKFLGDFEAKQRFFGLGVRQSDIDSCYTDGLNILKDALVCPELLQTYFSAALPPLPALSLHTEKFFLPRHLAKTVQVSKFFSDNKMNDLSQVVLPSRGEAKTLEAHQKAYKDKNLGWDVFLLQKAQKNHLANAAYLSNKFKEWKCASLDEFKVQLQAMLKPYTTFPINSLL